MVQHIELTHTENLTYRFLLSSQGGQAAESGQVAQGGQQQQTSTKRQAVASVENGSQVTLHST